jgi:hypothetical protein
MYSELCSAGFRIYFMVVDLTFVILEIRKVTNDRGNTLSEQIEIKIF